MIIEKLPETLDYNEKEPPFPFFNNYHFQYGYDIRRKLYLIIFILIHIHNFS